MSMTISVGVDEDKTMDEGARLGADILTSRYTTDSLAAIITAGKFHFDMLL